MAADPHAALPPRPEYATDDQLETNWERMSVPALITNAQNGVAPAQTVLAGRYLRGDGVESNAVAALEWYRKAATNGFAMAQNQLGSAYEQGNGVPKDTGDAIRWYRLAADQGLPAALRNMARLSLAKAAPELEPKDSARYYELAAEQGDLEAAVQLSRLYSHPPWGGSVDMETAVYWLQFAASKGYVRAYSGLGWYYMNEQVIGSTALEGDTSEARRWFMLGAQQDNPACDYGMAMFEMTVHSNAPDREEVRRWLLKSAAKNYPPAFYQLGQLSEQARPPNYSEAAEWYQRGVDAYDSSSSERLTQLAATGKVKLSGDPIARLRRSSDLGDMDARVELANRYLKGQGQPRNDADTPLALLESAQHVGNTRALLQLSDFYRTGTLVAKDPIHAVRFLFWAASYHSSEAYERIEQLQAESQRSDGKTRSPQDWQQAFTDFTRAVLTSKPEPAALLAKRYLDGTYATNVYQGFVWYTVAAGKHDEASAAEANRLQEQLDKSAQERAKAEANAIMIQRVIGLPGL